MSDIHDAALSGDLEKVKALLKANPDLVSSKDGGGATPLHAAAAAGRKNIVELLLAKGADANSKNGRGMTPFTVAQFAGLLMEDVIGGKTRT